MSYQLIGKIIGFKGLKGEMKIRPLSGFMLERLQPKSTIYIGNDQHVKKYIVNQYHEKQKTPLLLLNDYQDINLIQDLKGKYIYVDSESQLDLDEDTYHQDEIIGLKVYQNHQYMGQVIDIKNYPKDDYLQVETSKGNVLIPFRDEFINEMTDTYIDIIDMEGLF